MAFLLNGHNLSYSLLNVFDLFQASKWGRDFVERERRALAVGIKSEGDDRLLKGGINRYNILLIYDS